MARGAVERRNRTLRIYGIVALVGAVAAVIYCARGPGFDLSTPEKALDTFKRVMDDYRWGEAEKCLSDRCREHYAAAIADRRIFDFHSPHGYETQFGRFIPNWKVREVTATGGTARARIATPMPLAGGDVAGFWFDLVRCDDGLWRVDGPLVDFEEYYDRLIPKEARGWGRAVERK